MTTLVGRAHAPGVYAGPRAGNATMPADASTHRATTATGTADIAANHATATTATRGRVRCHADVIEGQVTEVTDPGAQQIGRSRRVTAIAAVAGQQALGDDQPVEGRGHPRIDREHLGLVLPADGHIGRAVVVQVTINDDVLGDHQLRVQVDRHARRIEGDRVARHRVAQGLTQRPAPRVGTVLHRNRRQAVLIPRHALVRQRRMALDGAGGDFKGPVAARARAVGRRGYIAPGELRQGVDKVDALVARCRVAGVDQDVATDVHVLADLREYFAASRDVVGRQVGITQPQVTRIAVADDLHRADALVAAQVIGNLLQAVLGRIQLHHLGTR